MVEKVEVPAEEVKETQEYQEEMIKKLMMQITLQIVKQLQLLNLLKKN